MESWEKEIRDRNSDFKKAIEKSDNPEVLELHELKEFLKSNNYVIETFDDIIKGPKDLSKLVKKEVWVNRGGKRYKQIVYVKPDDLEEKQQSAPIGGELTPTVSGMNVTKYSEKALLITGDTKSNVETLREIKKDTGVGSWNRKLNGWVFPISYLDKVLGALWSKFKDVGEDERAEAVKNQKNAALSPGDKANMGGDEITITKNTSDSEGSKYDVKTKDGLELNGVDEKTLEKSPEKDDKKISEIINNASPENRVKTEKKIYGVKPINNIHQYSLSEYMGMHGLSQADIDDTIKRLAAPKKEGKKKTTTSTPSKKKEPTSQKELTKRQLIGKLVYAHYQAVKKAIEAGEAVSPEVMTTYPDLKESYGKKRQAMSEETKRKISEALKKNKVPENENDQIKKENKEAEEQGGADKNLDKENYQPKIEKIKITSLNSTKTHTVKNYLDIPALDVIIPRQKDILSKPRPYYIPEIKDGDFGEMGFQIQAVKVGDDKYLVSLENYSQRDTKRVLNEPGNYRSGYKEVEVDIPLAYLTLDQVAATEQYYRLREKERIKIGEDKRFEGRLDVVRKTFPEMSEGEVKKRAKKSFSRSRAKILTDKKTTYSNQNFYNNSFRSRIIPPSGGSFWTHQRKLRKDIQQKFEDLSMQGEYIDSAYTKGAETSFGDKNTKDTLLNEYGVKVKRQNGDEITKSETDQIKDALDVTANLFGNNKDMNKEFGLKISHSGSKMMHARKAIGLFHPFYNAIGVSEAYGKNKFQFTFGHEYAHFMDYWIGKKTGNTYASDKEGSTAQIIADTFRENMNDKEPKSAYIKRTCECFARAFEQYTAIETYGDDVLKFEEFGVKYTDMPEQVDLNSYKTKIKPLIEQFLKENKDILKSSLFGDFLK